MGRTHVIGPDGSTHNTIAVWDGVTGKLLEDSGQTVAEVIAEASIGSGISELTGDVTAGPGTGSQAATIANDAVTNAKAANMAQSTIKGRAVGAGTGDPTDLTATQATAILDVMVGDSGSGGTKGLAPAPAAGDAAAGKFLKADGTYEVPSGTGIGTVTSVATDNVYVSGGTITSSGTVSAAVLAKAAIDMANHAFYGGI